MILRRPVSRRLLVPTLAVIIACLGLQASSVESGWAAPRAKRTAPLRAPRISKREAGHRLYNQVAARGLVDPAGGSRSLPKGPVTSIVSAGISDTTRKIDDIHVATTGPARSPVRTSYLVANHYEGPVLGKTAEDVRVHGPFQVDRFGTLADAPPVRTAQRVNLAALARETGLRARPNSSNRGDVVLLRGDAAVQRFFAQHIDRSIFRASGAHALNDLAGAGMLKDARLVQKGTTTWLKFHDGRGGRLVLQGR